MDKALILNKIKLHYNFSSDAEFARFIGVKPQVLSNWKSRNTYDAEIIYTKCLDINPEWLLTGKGDMLKDKYSIIDIDCSKIETQLNIAKETIQEQKEEIKTLTKEVGALEYRIKQYKKEHSS